MTIDVMLTVLNSGDKYGSAFREILEYYSIPNNDLSLISDDMAHQWLAKQKKGDMHDDI
jgi:hypothetical protein